MTSFIFGHLTGLLVGAAAGWWACARYAVGKGKTDWSWPGKPMRVLDMDRTEYSHWWERDE